MKIKLIIFAIVLPQYAYSFIFISGTNYSKGARPISQAPLWKGRTVTFYVNSNLSAYSGSLTPPVNSSEFVSAVTSAISAWSSACRSDIVLNFGGVTTARVNPSDQQNVIIWDNRTAGQGNGFGADQSILAAASSALADSQSLDCDIRINGNASLDFAVGSSISAGDVDLQSVLTHEIGHCLGLDHPVEPPTYTSVNTFLTAASMVQTATLPDPSDITRRTINQDDRDGIECMYERGRSSRSGSTCSSYHGTNGGVAISGAISGGPTETNSICTTDGEGQTTVESVNGSSGACAQSAIASTENDGARNSSAINWSLLFLFIFPISKLLYRRIVQKQLSSKTVPPTL